MLDENHPLESLRGAEYNPRKIDEEAIERLKDSITQLGVVKPIIARNGIIVAGHQRTKALRAIGATHAPVYLLDKDTTTYDEVRFNQLHNGTDTDTGQENCVISGLKGKSGFVQAPWDTIDANWKCGGAIMRNELNRLISRYGPFGACVATESGNVVHAASYAMCCFFRKVPCLVYVIPDDKADLYESFLNQEYGKFSYDHLERNSFIQTFAQLHRLRGKGQREMLSQIYEPWVKPYLKKHPDARLLDFGCGASDYVRWCKREGYNVWPFEPFPRRRGAVKIDGKAVWGMADRLIEDVRQNGRYDSVILDVVLPAVDSKTAEADVLNSADAFCKPGGNIWFSGISAKLVERYRSAKQATSGFNPSVKALFADDDNQSALFRNGSWYFQRYHSKERIEELCAERGWKIRKWKTGSTTFQCWVDKGVDCVTPKAHVESLRREFNLPLDKRGTTINRADAIEKVYHECLKLP